MSMYVAYRPLLDALIGRGVDPGAIEEAADEAERSGRSIRDVLINDLVVTELELTEASAQAHGLECVDLVGYPVEPTPRHRPPGGGAPASSATRASRRRPRRPPSRSSSSPASSGSRSRAPASS